MTSETPLIDPDTGLPTTTYLVQRSTLEQRIKALESLVEAMQARLTALETP